MSLYSLINDKVRDHFGKHPEMPDTPENRVKVLENLKDFMDASPELTADERYRVIQAINSEICVQRVKKYIKQAELF